MLTVSYVPHPSLIYLTTSKCLFCKFINPIVFLFFLHQHGRSSSSPTPAFVGVHRAASSSSGFLIKRCYSTLNHQNPTWVPRGASFLPRNWVNSFVSILILGRMLDKKTGLRANCFSLQICGCRWEWISAAVLLLCQVPEEPSIGPSCSLAHWRPWLLHTLCILLWKW